MYFECEQALHGNVQRITEIERVVALIADDEYDEAIDYAVRIKLEKGELESFEEISPDLEDYMEDINLEDFYENVEIVRSSVGQYKKEKFEVSASLSEAGVQESSPITSSLMDEEMGKEISIPQKMG